MQSYVSPTGIDKDVVLTNVIYIVTQLLDRDHDDGRSMELEVLRCVYEIGCLLLSALLGRACFEAANRDVARLSKDKRATSRFRLEAEGWCTVLSTLGPVCFPRFRYRFSTSGATVTRTPDCAALPMLQKCRSTLPLLKLTTVLGSIVPFRKAEELVSIVTHGEVSLHDSTIAKHCQHVAEAIDRKWLYATPENIKKILQQRALRDKVTGLPLLFFSTDAHAERLYVGDDYENGWKMLNGIRIWAIDEKTGRLIHLGGEFITGDCHDLAKVFEALNEAGILPFNGKWGDVQAQLVFVADGMPWFEEHVRANFMNLAVILDAYHVLERIAGFLSVLMKKGSKRYRELYAMLCRRVTGRTPSGKKTKSSRLRSDKRKDEDGNPIKKPVPPAREYPELDPSNMDYADRVWELPANSASGLIVAIEGIKLSTCRSKWRKQSTAMFEILRYLLDRYDHIDYAKADEHGWSIGSAPMESFNRIAQGRLKLPGATWTPGMAQAMLNLRLLYAVGRFDEFWASDEAYLAIQDSFLRAA